MIKSKYFGAIAAIMVAAALIASLFLVYAGNNAQSEKVPEYEKKLFNGDVLSIDIGVDPDEWQNLLDNAMAKEYLSADVTVNGEIFTAVGIRTKGNSSLSSVSNSDSDRYSLQLKFDSYVKGRTCYGLDTFVINNMMGDATYMKDTLAYEIMDYAGVPTPLRTYAEVTVNGEPFGFYLVLERYEKSFLDRAYNTSAGQLYNVKIAMGQRENFEAGEFEPAARQQAGDTQPQQPQAQTDNRQIQQARGQGLNPQPQQPQAQAANQENPQNNQRMRGGEIFGGGGGMSGNRSGGGSLLYSGDDPGAYSSIFDNAEFGEASDKETARVITAIKALNEGVSLEDYWDVDEILRYIAAHTVVVNLDSYFSNMQQNYYIYERDGKLSILPWDYGLSFGGFQNGNASGVINFPIDTPVSGVNMEDRPLVAKLLEVAEYKELYHRYLNEIVEGFFNSGLFETTIYSLDAVIGEYVRNDASAFFDYGRYQASLPTLVQVGLLRAQSIAGQLDGSIPSTTAGQNADPGALIDASGVNLSDLGSMGMGGGGGRNMNANTNGEQGGNMPGFGGAQNGMAFTDPQNAQEIMEIIMAAQGGGLTDEQLERLRELGVTDEQMAMFGQTAQDGGQRQFAGNRNVFPGQTQNSAVTAENLNAGDWIFYGILGVFLLGAILFMTLSKRRRFK